MRISSGINLLQTKDHLLHIRNQSVPRSKHFSTSYKNQSVNDVSSKSRRLFLDLYKTLNAKRAPCWIFLMLNLVVGKVIARL
jgi:hypothetical protein